MAAVPSETGYTPSASPVTNADTTDAELLRFETSSMDMDTHREQDFGYEVIDRTLADVNQLQDEFEGDDELSEREVLQPVGQAPPSLRKDMASKHQKSSQSQNQQLLDDQEQLVEQYRGTPERKVPSRNKRRAQPHPASSPRHEVSSIHKFSIWQIRTTYFLLLCSDVISSFPEANPLRLLCLPRSQGVDEKKS